VSARESKPGVRRKPRRLDPLTKLLRAVDRAYRRALYRAWKREQ